MNQQKINLQIYSLLEMESDFYLLNCLTAKSSLRHSRRSASPYDSFNLFSVFQWFSLRPLLGGCALFFFSCIGFILGVLIWTIQMPHHFWRGLLQGVTTHILLSVGIPFLLYYVGRLLAHNLTRKQTESQEYPLFDKIQEQISLLTKYYDILRLPSDFQNLVALSYVRDFLKQTPLSDAETLPSLLQNVRREMEADGVWELTQSLQKDRSSPQKYLAAIDQILPHLTLQRQASIQNTRIKAERLAQDSALSDFDRVQEIKIEEYSQLFFQ